ncbi:MAG: SAM-dependent methyltransferase [Fibrobacteres bacterium]|nr:SAM-dependent methyltransferase [Fibrobacterota bacterium]
MSGAPGFKDHFSGHSGGYARARPVYPESLFDHLASLVPARDAVWDCGTGTGQAARSLASRFRTVIATDASANQVASAGRSPGGNADPQGIQRILFAAAPAERAPLRDGSMDLITVAQALHWFDFPAFFAEARRVAKPGGAVAVWCYGNCRITPAVDAVYHGFYQGVVGPYWPPERAHIEDGYASIPFPFAPLPCPAFAIEARWDMEELLAYLDTWSAVQYYRKAKAEDPLALVRDAMARAWGDPGEPRLITWPLSLKAGRVDA